MSRVKPKISATNSQDVFSEALEGVQASSTSRAGTQNFDQVLNQYGKDLEDMKGDFEAMKEEIADLQKNLQNSTNKNIEIIGIFSAILALLIIDVSIIKSVDTFLTAILLLVGLTVSLIIFLSVVHYFFAPEKEKRLGWTFTIGMVILGILLILGIFNRSFGGHPLNVQIDGSSNGQVGKP